MKYYKNIIIVILLIIIAWFGVANCNLEQNNREFQKDLNVATNKITYVVDEFNRERAETNLLIGNLRDIKDKNSLLSQELGGLRKEIDKLTISLTGIGSVTNYQFTKHTDSVLVGIDKSKPIYITEKSDQWFKIKIRASYDSTTFKLTTFDSLIIKTGYKPRRFFFQKLNPPIVSVINLNPYAHTRSLKSFMIDMPKQKRGVFIIGGVVIGITGTVLVYKLLQK